MNIQEYLEHLIDQELEKLDTKTLYDVLKSLSGLHMNWIGELVTESSEWEVQELLVSDIRLTGMSDQLNRILIHHAQREPAQVIEIMNEDSDVRESIELHATHSTDPILVRRGEDGHWWVLDGMDRVLGALLRDQSTIQAWVPQVELLPEIEPHVIYDLIKSVGPNPDEESRKDLNGALRLLSKRYVNVSSILHEYFVENETVPDSIQDIFSEYIDIEEIEEEEFSFTD